MGKVIFNISSDNIENLKPNEIFVFGSNLLGYHGAGAALKALEFGAMMHKPVGLQGSAYAIPTKDANFNPLSLGEIDKYVKRFIQFAKHHPKKQFLVTKIGCGLAGYKEEQIAPMFADAQYVKNIHIPMDFAAILIDKIIEKEK